MRINGKFAVQPSLTEVFDLHADLIGSKLRVCSVGEIVGVNPARRTVSVSIGETMVLPNGAVVPILAPLLDVPVFTLQGSGAHIGMPIEVGDECLVVFNDFNLDNWLDSGGQQVPEDARQHDISDAIALVGLNSGGNPLLSALAGPEAGLATATAKVAVNVDTELVTVGNSAATLMQVLNNIIAAINASNAPAGANTLSQLIGAVRALAAAVAAMTTASINSGVPQAAAATVVSSLSGLTATVSAQSTAAAADAAAAQAFAEALFY